MKSYLERENQIKGIKNVSETVRTMEKIAASSIHFLKREVSILNAYATEVEKTLARLSLFFQRNRNPLLRKNEAGKKALIILMGDKGLVGGLWHNIIGAFLENAGRSRVIFAVGVKSGDYLKEENALPVKLFSRFSDIPKKEEAERVTDYIFNEFKKGKFSRVDILYPRFVSLAEQEPNFIPFLPFRFGLAEKKEIGGGLPIFEPMKREIFNRLLQKHIEVFFYRIIMEAKLSELSARTAAMEQAASKAEKIIRDLALACAKERRRIITQRQLESFAARKL